MLFGCGENKDSLVECVAVKNGKEVPAAFLSQFTLDSITYSNGNSVHQLSIELLVDGERVSVSIETYGNPLKEEFVLVTPWFGQSKLYDEILTVKYGVIEYTRRSDNDRLYIKNSLTSAR